MKKVFDEEYKFKFVDVGVMKFGDEFVYLLFDVVMMKFV